MSYLSEVLADSPLGYWRLDETSGTTLADSSGNSETGSYINSPTLGQPSLLLTDPATSVNFNGTNQYATIAGAAWMNVTDYSAEILVQNHIIRLHV